jgi:F-type H+-transporting ATPase subunit gamma
MPTTREIRRRIGAVKNTQTITRTMKMVSVAKMRRAQDRIIALRPYAQAMRRMLANVVASAPHSSHLLIVPRALRNVAVMVVTSDRGLCGAFNTNIIRLAVHRIEELQKQLPAGGKVHLVCVGRKSFEFFSRRGYHLIAEYPGFFQHLTFTASRQLSDEIVTGYLNGRYDAVEMVYSEFRSIAQLRPVVERLVPFILPTATTEPVHAKAEYIYEPDPLDVLERLIPKNVTMQVWKVFLESSASEHSARMLAMESATKNAGDLIKKLSLQYNKARQASITKEILEIVSGAEALKGG